MKSMKTNVDEAPVSKEFGIVDFVTTCLRSSNNQLAKIYHKRHYQRNIVNLTKSSVEMFYNLRNLSNDECDHLQDVGCLIIRLLNNVNIDRTQIMTLFERFSQHEHRSMSLSKRIAGYIDKRPNPKQIKVLCRWLDVFSHYNVVIGDDQSDDLFRSIMKHLDHPFDHFSCLGSFFFYLGSISNSNVKICRSSSDQCRQFIISSVEEIETWSSETLHCVMGIVFGLPMNRSEKYHRALLTILESAKLQKALAKTCINDETMLIHTITEHLVRWNDFERFSLINWRQWTKPLLNLYKNLKNNLTKANVCHVLFSITSRNEYISDQMLIDYFQCISELKQTIKNTLKRCEKRNQLVHGILTACCSESMRQKVIQLRQMKKLEMIDEDFEELIHNELFNGRRTGNPSSVSLDHFEKIRFDQFVSLAPPPSRFPQAPAQQLRTEDVHITSRYDIIIKCTTKSFTRTITNHIAVQGYRVLTLNWTTTGDRNEKNILRCKTMIVYVDDDYDEHRSEMVLAYKNQVPIILLITGERKDVLSDDYFLQFIFEQSSLLSYVIYINDSEQAMDQLIHSLKKPRPINRLGPRRQAASSQITHGATTNDLYEACSKNNIEKVRRYLREINIEIINQLNSNGTTALHIAAYQGHDEIVRLLLDAGASTTIRNRSYNLTAYEETTNPRIKLLFDLHHHKNPLSPFINDNLRIEWTCAFQNPIKKQRQLRDKLKQLLEVKDYNYEEVFKEIRESMDMILNDWKLSQRDIRVIKDYFQRLNRDLDPVHIVKCYSSTTSFYRHFNENIAKNVLEYFDHNLVNLNTDYRAMRYLLQLVAIVMHHDRFRGEKFRGVTYRGVLMSRDDLTKYIVGTNILNTSFLSTSKQNDIARFFSGNIEATKLRKTRDKKPLQYSVICCYDIKNRDNALDIETISERGSDEKEVLILPFSAFKVTKVDKTSSDFVEIFLEESLDEEFTF